MAEEVDATDAAELAAIDAVEKGKEA